MLAGVRACVIAQQVNWGSSESGSKPLTGFGNFESRGYAMLSRAGDALQMCIEATLPINGCK